jgi:hypothetical protein
LFFQIKLFPQYQNILLGYKVNQQNIQPIASVKANTEIVKPNSCCRSDRLRAKGFTKAAKTIPMPAPITAIDS